MAHIAHYSCSRCWHLMTHYLTAHHRAGPDTGLWLDIIQQLSCCEKRGTNRHCDQLKDETGLWLWKSKRILKYWNNNLYIGDIVHLISSQMTLPWDWDCGCDPESGSGEGPINLPGQYSVMSRDLFIIPGHKSQSQHYNWVWGHYDHLCWSLWAVLWNMSPTPALSMEGRQNAQLSMNI